MNGEVFTSAMQVSPYQSHWLLHPNVYVAPRINQPINIDGNLEKEEWSNVPWSSQFDDIRGEDDAPPSSRPSPECRTRMKMLWDDEYLYIGAMIESDMEVRATYRERNSPIYHEDSDFEVFVDPHSSCHFYKELEMNAINTVWNLMLDKPYADGGQEYSGRIAKPGDDNYYDVTRQKTAVRVVEGSLNDEGEKRTVWTVEIALAHSDTLKHASLAQSDDSLLLPTSSSSKVDVPPTPTEGDRWRINFSRVEKKGDINWTWQRQRVWDPLMQAHIGKVDMHMPDAFGYVKFGPSVEEAQQANVLIGQIPPEQISEGRPGAVDGIWPALLVAMNVYYSQRAYFDSHGSFAMDLDGLKEYLDDAILAPFVEKISLSTGDNGSSYLVNVHGAAGGKTVSVNNSRLLQIFSSLDRGSNNWFSFLKTHQ